MLASLSLELLSVSESDPELLSESLDELLPLLLLPLLLRRLEGTEALQVACWTRALQGRGTGRGREEGKEWGRKGREGEGRGGEGKGQRSRRDRKGWNRKGRERKKERERGEGKQVSRPEYTVEWAFTCLLPHICAL